MMKHTLKITLFLLVLFLAAQTIGLYIVYNGIDKQITVETGNLTYEALPYNIERPPVEEKGSIVYLIGAILIGTVIVLLIIKFNKIRYWKIWYGISVILCLSIALSVFIDEIYAFILSLILTWWKVIKPNIFVHNLTELFIYGGLALIFVPIIKEVYVAAIILILISGYDMYAVWKSKHMVKMANFQTNVKSFAGLSIPYKAAGVEKIEIPAAEKTVVVKERTAVLGGGDIGFPLMFAGVVMGKLILENPGIASFFQSLIIPLFVTIALAILLYKGESGKFYPAMPFLTIGCFAGYLVLWFVKNHPSYMGGML